MDHLWTEYTRSGNMSRENAKNRAKFIVNPLLAFKWGAGEAKISQIKVYITPVDEYFSSRKSLKPPRHRQKRKAKTPKANRTAFTPPKPFPAMQRKEAPHEPNRVLGGNCDPGLLHPPEPEKALEGRSARGNGGNSTTSSMTRGKPKVILSEKTEDGGFCPVRSACSRIKKQSSRTRPAAQKNQFWIRPGRGPESHPWRPPTDSSERRDYLPWASTCRSATYTRPAVRKNRKKPECPAPSGPLPCEGGQCSGLSLPDRSPGSPVSLCISPPSCYFCNHIISSR